MSKERLLLIEDNQDYQQLFRHSIKIPTSQLEMHSGAESATYASKFGPFGVAVIDFYLPGTNGAEVAKQLLRLNANIKIVIISAVKSNLFDDYLTGLPIQLIYQKPLSAQNYAEIAKLLH